MKWLRSSNTHSPIASASIWPSNSVITRNRVCLRTSARFIIAGPTSPTHSMAPLTPSGRPWSAPFSPTPTHCRLHAGLPRRLDRATTVMENTGSGTLGFAILPKINLTFGGIIDDISYSQIDRGYTSFTGTTGINWQALPSLSLSAACRWHRLPTTEFGHLPVCDALCFPGFELAIGRTQFTQFQLRPRDRSQRCCAVHGTGGRSIWHHSSLRHHPQHLGAS